MNTVSIRLKGGLGNYMFQIAACEAYALEHEKKPLYNFGTAYRAQKEINSYVDNIFRGVNEETKKWKFLIPNPLFNMPKTQILDEILF